MTLPPVILVVTLLGQSNSTAATNAQLVEAAQKSAAAAERSARAAERAAEAIEALVKSRPANVDAIASAPAVAKPAPVVHVDRWTGAAGLSLIWLSGNANALTFAAAGSAEKKWGPWGLGLKAYATYGQSTDPVSATTQVTALSAGAKVRGDRNASEHVTIFVAFGGDTNHVKSVEFVGFGEAGAGIVWLNHKEPDYEKVYLRTDLSIHYEHETDFNYYPTAAVPTTLFLGTRQLLGPRFSGLFRYALRKDVLFSQDAEVIPNILGEARTRVNTNTKLASRLTETLSMNASFQVQYDSAPPAGKVSTDTALSVGVELAL